MEEISAAVRDVSGDDFRSISYEAQQLLKSVRASNGYSDGADAAFYRAYFEGFSGKTRSDSKILSNAALEAAYQMGADAKNDVGTFHTVGNATISKEATAFLAKAAKDLGLSITYGGKGSVSNGGVVNGAVRRGVRRGYANSYRGIHIYEDAKVQEVGGKTLVGGDAAARIILGHELTHILQKQSPTQYKAFEAFALRQRSEQGSKIGLDLVSEYMRDLRLDKQSATDEVVANYAMRALFSDMKTAREVTKHHSKVAEAIRRAFTWIREKLGIRTSEVDRAAAMWNKAYNESRKNADAAVAEAVNRAKGVAEAGEASGTVKYSRSDIANVPEIESFVKQALNGSQTDTKEIAEISAVENRAISKFAGAYGDGYRGKYTGGKHIIDTEHIRHAKKAHGDIVLEALRAQLPVTEDDIVATLSAIANGQARIIAPTYTALGQESILQEVPVNGYTLYAEEIIRTGKEKPSNLEGRTIYKTPTKTTVQWLGTSPSTLPRNLGGASTNSIHENINLSTGNILLNNAGVEQDLYVAVVNGSPVGEKSANGLIFLSADKSNIDAPDGSIRKVHIKTEKPFYITADNVVYKSSTDNVAQKVKALEGQGFDCFIFDYHEGDRYAVMVKNKAQILPVESASPSFGKVKDSIAMPNMDSEGNTLSEAQQEFFSSSLVTDEDGALLPVYHATDSAEFTVFDKSKLGYNTDGNTSDEGMAATAHVGFWFNTKNLIGEAGSRSEKVYLNLTNPYELTSLDALAEEIKALGEGETPAEMGEAYATDLWLRGYDGIEIRNDEEFGGTSYVAFDENQIKRTTNKNPTKDADIRYSTSLSD